MKFTPALFVASAAALAMPAHNGAEQSPPDTISLGWGRGNSDQDNQWSTNSNPSWGSSFPSSSYNLPGSGYNPGYIPGYNPYSNANPNPYRPYVAPAPVVPAPAPYSPPFAAPIPDDLAEANAPLAPGQGAPQQVTIEKTGYSGNGCPAGSVSTLISPDKTVVTFGFDTFQATIGPGSKAADKQKNCQLHLGLRYPAGYQMSIMTATYHGYVRLDPGVTANFISSYYFSQAAEKTAMTRTTLQGPEYANGKTYTKSDSIANESMIWSPCGANGILNVNNRIALTSPNPNAAGEISNDDATLKFEQKLHIQWRPCPGGPRRDVDISGIETANTVTDSVIDLH